MGKKKQIMQRGRDKNKERNRQERAGAALGKFYGSFKRTLTDVMLRFRDKANILIS